MTCVGSSFDRNDDSKRRRTGCPAGVGNRRGRHPCIHVHMILCLRGETLSSSEDMIHSLCLLDCSPIPSCTAGEGICHRLTRRPSLLFVTYFSLPQDSPGFSDLGFESALLTMHIPKTFIYKHYTRNRIGTEEGRWTVAVLEIRWGKSNGIL